jgi:nitrite reductase/ring-hydroxylating ferredoxin subunit
MLPVALQRFPLCRRDELERARFVTRWLDDLGDEVTAVLLDGRIVVRSSVCPHFAGEFVVDLARRTFRCKWHAWEFEIESGRCVSNGFKGCLRRYEADERDGMVDVLYDV